MDCYFKNLATIKEKVAFHLFTNGFNIKRKNMKEKKEVSSINPLKLIKKV